MGSIKVNHLTKEYFDQAHPLKVVHDLSFECNENDFFCILGKSGCGKSSLLKMIGGFDTDYQGQILCNDKDVSQPSKEIFLIFQDDHQLFPWKTILNNILIPMKKCFPNENIDLLKEKALAYLKIVELEDYIDYYPNKLSGGMKQRVAIARALALEPSVLLMDEPFSSLDAQTRENLQDLLINIWQKTKTTILFVTHDIDEAIKLSSHILIMGHAPYSHIDTIANPLSFPRNSEHPDFIAIKTGIRQML